MKLYDHPSAMEPLFPAESRELGERAFEVVQAAGQLSGCVHPITREGIADLVRLMNSYYSNLIEGHNTHPLDIERALNKDYSRDPAQRALQLESAAHIHVQELLEGKLRSKEPFEICDPASICWIHEQFYERMPESFRLVRAIGGQEERVIPGQVRQVEVAVGRHVGPEAGSVPRFLARFAAAYQPGSLGPLPRILAAAASHHRLAWIHPFLDGNGRVARLFTHAYLVRAGLDGQGLWTISRGLARHKDQYLAALAGADAARRNDLDGRGNLSNSGLTEFCSFFLRCCLDQVKYMTTLLDLDAMLERIHYFGEQWARTHKHDVSIVALLQQAFLRGEITRGEATQILGQHERTARRSITDLIEHGLLSTAGPGKPVRLGFPTHAVGYYFPRLYPEGVELSLPRFRPDQD